MKTIQASLIVSCLLLPSLAFATPAGVYDAATADSSTVQDAIQATGSSEQAIPPSADCRHNLHLCFLRSKH